MAWLVESDFKWVAIGVGPEGKRVLDESDTFVYSSPDINQWYRGPETRAPIPPVNVLSDAFLGTREQHQALTGRLLSQGWEPEPGVIDVNNPARFRRRFTEQAQTAKTIERTLYTAKSKDRMIKVTDKRVIKASIGGNGALQVLEEYLIGRIVSCKVAYYGTFTRKPFAKIVLKGSDKPGEIACHNHEEAEKLVRAINQAMSEI